MSGLIKKTVQVAVPLEHAFEVFTAHVDAWWPPGHRKFEGSTLTFEARVGGRFIETSATGQQAVFGEVRLWEPPNRVVYSWHPGSTTGPTEVDVRFVADGTGTRVEVTHSEAQSGLGAEWNQRAALFTNAWDRVLAAFTEYSTRAAEGSQ